MIDSGRRRVMVVFAHPDDAEFTCGGTVARWAARGDEIRYVVCTDGSKGSDDPALSPPEVATLREQEQRAAAEVLGVKEVVFLKYPDGELVNTSGLKVELVRLIRRFRPDRLLTWDPSRRYQFHPDHRATGQVALDAVLAAGQRLYFPEQLGGQLWLHRVTEVWLFGTDEPDEWVDITRTFDLKQRAMACHGSQITPQPDVLDYVAARNRDLGVAHHLAYAEAFKVVRPFRYT